MPRDLSAKAIKKNGKFIRCQICKQHNAIADFAGVYACRRCFRAFMIGFMTGRMVN